MWRHLTWTFAAVVFHKKFHLCFVYLTRNTLLGLVQGVPAGGRGLELGDLQGPFQHKRFYDSMKYVVPSESLAVLKDSIMASLSIVSFGWALQGDMGGWGKKQGSPTSLLFLRVLPNAGALALLLHQCSLMLFAFLPPTLSPTSTHAQTSFVSLGRIECSWWQALMPAEVAHLPAGTGQCRGKLSVCYSGQQSWAQDWRCEHCNKKHSTS